MNLVFIYGPPASGKLTIANELKTITGYSVFHNHLTRDLVQSIYPDSLRENYELVDALREDVLAYCALHETSLIFTFVYDGPEDNDVVSKKVNAVVENGGTIHFVELTTPHDILLKRVGNNSRKLHKKLTDSNELKTLLKNTAYSSLPYSDVFKVDTSINNPVTTASLIKQHFNLT